MPQDFAPPMPDARISTAFPYHPKTKKLERLLGASGPWCMVKLILWTAENRSDGDLNKMSTEDIEIAIDWDGEEGAFVKALSKFGFLDGKEGEYRLHDWEQHNPWVSGFKNRQAKAIRNARKRWGDSGVEGSRSSRLEKAREKGKHTAKQFQALIDYVDGRCMRCGKLNADLVRDHITPIYLGGSDGIDNVQPLCRSCNAGKGSESKDYRPEGWMEWLLDACEMPATSPEMPAEMPAPLLEQELQAQAELRQDQGQKTKPPKSPFQGDSSLVLSSDPPAPAVPKKRASKKSEAITFESFVAACKAAGEKSLPKEHSVFSFAKATGIPEEFLQLAWREFVRRHKGTRKMQKGVRGWRQAFENYVRLNYYKLWYFPAEGVCELTTAGIGLRREKEAA